MTRTEPSTHTRPRRVSSVFELVTRPDERDTGAPSTRPRELTHGYPARSMPLRRLTFSADGHVG
ncbi:hypothetical protein GCM10017687_36700 [Streptomyces echinatus]